ncbi:MAG: hypothetical protein QOD75_1896 [Blastocatellia bacterium]|jgi:hypothetical protein|nr:hypothetical protein [Blastocatellia bacterium]
MYCPHCGQQQINEVVRFCSRCGFPLEGVMHLLASGGLLPTHQQGPPTISPRKKGVRQGGMMLILGALIVPLFGVLASYSQGRLGDLFGMLTAMTALILFAGGVLRMMYAGLFEDGAPKGPRIMMPYVAPPMPAQLGVLDRSAALPPANTSHQGAWLQRPNTAELVRPPSVTENTTRLLDKDDSTNR